MQPRARIQKTDARFQSREAAEEFSPGWSRKAEPRVSTSLDFSQRFVGRASAPAPVAVGADSHVGPRGDQRIPSRKSFATVCPPGTVSALLISESRGLPAAETVPLN